jgi:hypothetical protein
MRQTVQAVRSQKIVEISRGIRCRECASSGSQPANSRVLDLDLNQVPSRPRCVLLVSNELLQSQSFPSSFGVLDSGRLPHHLHRQQRIWRRPADGGSTKHDGRLDPRIFRGQHPVLPILQLRGDFVAGFLELLAQLCDRTGVIEGSICRVGFHGVLHPGESIQLHYHRASMDLQRPQHPGPEPQQSSGDSGEHELRNMAHLRMPLDTEPSPVVFRQSAGHNRRHRARNSIHGVGAK